MATTSYIGNAVEVLKTFADKSINCIVTSPPYWKLRDYQTGKWVGGDAACHHTTNKRKSNATCKHCGAAWIDKQIGLEQTPRQFIESLIAVFKECYRVLSDDGTCWVNIGDSYNSQGGGQVVNTINSNRKGGSDSQNRGEPRNVVAGYKPKDLIGVPWMLAFALRDEVGFYLRQDIIWSKPNPMPESVTDRCTKAHEYVFLLSKKRQYFYDAEAIKTDLLDPERDLRGISENHKNTDGAPGQTKHTITQARPNRRAHAIVRDRMLNYNSKTKEMYAQGQRGNLTEESDVPVDMGMANKRSVWEVTSTPYKGVHYAVFPEKLAEPMVKAGTSEYGCCAQCGKQYIRLTTKKLIPTAKASYNTQPDNRDMLADGNDQGSNRTKDGHKPGWINETTTVGWKKPCKCATDEIRPALVLDPFGGSGTVAVIAGKLNRNAILIDLNAKYVREDQARRLHEQLGVFNKHQIIEL